ncbi:MAG: metalloregulator ArsR/SmtB family transcription factor [Thermoflexales bacterium]|nr:metalloregulator ArsR/SmtB family transcription factor [Thermoflexales bacterium]MDW8350432.1 metalloregulator ArsR/SmtB family transcription factor [Anaerolineae bacterium]
MDTARSAPALVANSAETFPAELGRLHTVLKSLSEPNRLRIFALLTHGERCVCDIESAMTIPQNLASHHLRVLREAGLIEVRREGRWAYYRINKVYLSEVYPALCSLFDPNSISDARAAC